MGTMINRRRACGGKKGLLPSGYKQLDYIENTSNAYIDTGVYSSVNLNIICDFSATYINNGTINYPYWMSPFGVSITQFSFSLNIHNNQVSSLYGGTWIDIESPLTLELNKKYTVEHNATEVYFDGYLVGTFSGGTSTGVVNLFNRGQVGSSCPLRGKIYKCIMKESGVIVRNFIPCKNPNNVVGMYDLVNGVFYSSPNGTAFVAGPEV